MKKLFSLLLTVLLLMESVAGTSDADAADVVYGQRKMFEHRFQNVFRILIDGFFALKRLGRSGVYIVVYEFAVFDKQRARRFRTADIECKKIRAHKLTRSFFFAQIRRAHV